MHLLGIAYRFCADINKVGTVIYDQDLDLSDTIPTIAKYNLHKHNLNDNMHAEWHGSGCLKSWYLHWQLNNNYFYYDDRVAQW